MNFVIFDWQDPAAWNNVAGFDLSNTTSSPSHNPAAYTDLLQEKSVYSSMGFTINSPGAAASGCTHPSKPTQASTGRKRRRDKGEPLCDRTCSSFLENVSPKKTPTKSQPFTPSQVDKFSFYLILLASPARRWWISHVANVCFVLFFFSSVTYLEQST